MAYFIVISRNLPRDIGKDCRSRGSKAHTIMGSSRTGCVDPNRARDIGYLASFEKNSKTIYFSCHISPSVNM
jgi:hypothetical protein